MSLNNYQKRCLSTEADTFEPIRLSALSDSVFDSAISIDVSSNKTHSVYEILNRILIRLL